MGTLKKNIDEFPETFLSGCPSPDGAGRPTNDPKELLNQALEDCYTITKWISSVATKTSQFLMKSLNTWNQEKTLSQANIAESKSSCNDAKQALGQFSTWKNTNEQNSAPYAVAHENAKPKITPFKSTLHSLQHPVLQVRHEQQPELGQSQAPSPPSSPKK